MPTVIVEPDLYSRVEQAALENQSDVGELFAKVVRFYLWELDRRKISEESEIYRQRYKENL